MSLFHINGIQFIIFLHHFFHFSRFCFVFFPSGDAGPHHLFHLVERILPGGRFGQSSSGRSYHQGAGRAEGTRLTLTLGTSSFAFFFAGFLIKYTVFVLFLVFEWELASSGPGPVVQACGMQCDELVYNTLMDGCVKANETWVIISSSNHLCNALSKICWCFFLDEKQHLMAFLKGYKTAFLDQTNLVHNLIQPVWTRKTVGCSGRLRIWVLAWACSRRWLMLAWSLRPSHIVTLWRLEQLTMKGTQRMRT